MKLFIHYIIIILIPILIISCSEDETKINPTEGLTKIGEAFALGAGAKVELWANEDLFSGYNSLYVAMFDSTNGKRIKESHVHFNPIMTMVGGMQHSCPVINPEDENAVKELFPGAAIFIMPSSDMGYWKMNISVDNLQNGKSGIATFDVDVFIPTAPRTKSFVTGSGEKIFIAYNFPTRETVGVNDFDVTIHKMVSSTEFTPVDSYNISLEPEMPSMDHGSPNNVDPVYDEVYGQYRGKVNFTMTGEWRLNLILNRGDESLPLFFDVTLE